MAGTHTTKDERLSYSPGVYRSAAAFAGAAADTREKQRHVQLNAENRIDRKGRMSQENLGIFPRTYRGSGTGNRNIRTLEHTGRTVKRHCCPIPAAEGAASGEYL